MPRPLIMTKIFENVLIVSRCPRIPGYFGTCADSVYQALLFPPPREARASSYAGKIGTGDEAKLTASMKRIRRRIWNRLELLGCHCAGWGNPPHCRLYAIQCMHTLITATQLTQITVINTSHLGMFYTFL